MSLAYNRKVGVLIRRERERAGLSQEQLGKAIRKHRQMIAAYETGRHAIRLDTLRSIARRLRIQITELIPWE